MRPTPRVAGILGVLAGIGLVGEFVLWAGTPFLTDLAVRDQSAASPAWEAFAAVTNASNGLGNLFLGLSLLTAGWAIVSTRALPPMLGWIALVAGAATVMVPLGLDAAFLVSLPLAVVVRIRTGIQLWQHQ